jgi:hypothetical protein
MENNKIVIAESKTTQLRIRVTYTDSHITRGIVLKPDRFNKIGDVNYWSTSTLNIITDEHKDMKVLCKKNYLDFKDGVEYSFKKSKDNFMIQFENGEWVCDDEDKVLEYFEIVKKDEVLLVDGLIQFNEDKIKNLKDKFETPKHYNNDNGTLYKVAEERGWNSYLFDIVKRLERSEKKGEFRTDLEKSKVVIDLWLKESDKL